MILDEKGHPMAPVHVCWGDGEAQVVASYLQAHGIEAVINSEVPHSVLPITADGLGEVRVLVPESEREAALECLAQRSSASPDLT